MKYASPLVIITLTTLVVIGPYLNKEWCVIVVKRQMNIFVCLLYCVENKLLSMRWWYSFCTMSHTTRLNLTVLAHWNKNPWIKMSIHSETWSRFWANQSLLILPNAVWLARKQQILILKSLHWHDQCCNPRSTAVEV